MTATPASRGALVAALLYRWRWVFVAFLSSRLIIYMLIRLSRMILQPGELWQRNGVTGMLTESDAAQYLQVATTGYGSGQEALVTVGAFPLYSLLVRVFSLIFDPTAAAFIVSNFALLGAGILLKELIDSQYKQPRLSGAAVTFMMFSPLSFVFSGAYPESTFLLFSLGAFVAAARSRWLSASLCGMCVAATSTIGFLITIPLLVECLRASGDGRWPKSHLASRALMLGLVPLGCALFLWFSYSRTGDAFAPFRASPLWAGGFVPPWTALESAQLLPKFYRNFTILMLCAGFVTWLAGIVLRMRISHALYAGLLLGAFLCSFNLPSIARELSVVFPLFIALALLSRRFEWLYEPLLASSFTLLSFCTVMAANGHWMR